ncbi:hypothetical protein GCM10011390_49910 [Aureimonas endophytica]|uniref:Uncharacterized protein n=1 Tax=Aureimonas endophytica TaxID=2027858 RepID=A0A917A5F1_9HYPH|nr:hypothetical protein [Aureimonas endophytica]GGE24494.1 hypothetical protein GCM10011390_49910 [Aureimonas endophytica]
MILIHHRRNSVAELDATSVEWGVEIDLRNHGDEILVTHDPFVTEAVKLETWLDHYRHRFLIANVKEEGMEPRLLRLLAERDITDFFILDESFPFIRKHALAGIPNFAVRVSEYESAETALNLARLLREAERSVDWIWADSFTGAPLPESDNRALKQADYRICVVSPELHHVPEPSSWQWRIEAFVAQLKEQDPAVGRPDMVCTKLPELWAEAMRAG